MAMNKPSLDELLVHVEDRYTLVVVSAKRARQITEKALMQDTGMDPEMVSKPVSAALQETVQGNIKYRRTSQGIK
ncbi:MAG: DNA-directed RNA polymerase subunit omega [Desulfotomaculaceae bacterium]